MVFFLFCFHISQHSHCVPFIFSLQVGTDPSFQLKHQSVFLHCNTQLISTKPDQLNLVTSRNSVSFIAFLYESVLCWMLRGLSTAPTVPFKLFTDQGHHHRGVQKCLPNARVHFTATQISTFFNLCIHKPSARAPVSQHHLLFLWHQIACEEMWQREWSLISLKILFLICLFSRFPQDM